MVIYAAFSCYFSGIMVRLILTLTPVVCMLGGIAMSVTFNHYLKTDDQESITKPAQIKTSKAKGNITSTIFVHFVLRISSVFSAVKAVKTEEVEPEEHTPMAIKLTVIMALTGLLSQFAIHCTYITSNYYSSPSVVLASSRPDGSRNIIDDYR